MLLIQFVNPIDTSTFPVEIVQSFKHDTYLIDVQLNEYDIINDITSKYTVLSMQSNDDCAYIDVLERHTTSYTTVQACLLYTSPSPRDQRGSRMPSSA